MLPFGLVSLCMLLAGCGVVLADLLRLFPVLPLATSIIFCEVFVVGCFFGLLLIALLVCWS
jgi:hypothetical protein